MEREREEFNTGSDSGSKIVFHCKHTNNVYLSLHLQLCAKPSSNTRLFVGSAQLKMLASKAKFPAHYIVM